MADTNVRSLDRSIHKTNEWLNALAAKLDRDEEIAYKAFRGYLHAVRDCLNVDEATHFAAQLPVVLRGVFYEGWDPSQTPRRMKRDEFLDAVRRMGALEGEGDPAPERVVIVVSELLRGKISDGELEDVFTQLKGEVRELLEAA